jgi:hypothetical protein
MVFGMCNSQLSIGRPKMRNGMPWPRRWAAIERPYGPAPTIAISVMRGNRSFEKANRIETHQPIRY